MTTPTAPGPWIFTDAIGAPAQRIEVIREGDELLAQFPAEDGEDGCLVPVADMNGDWAPAP